jgi:excisionase family DNA binding protein
MTSAPRSVPIAIRPHPGIEEVEPGATVEDSTRFDERLRRPTVSVDIAAQLLGISRASAFRAVHREQLPAIRLGRRIMIPTSELRRLLHLTAPTEA